MVHAEVLGAHEGALFADFGERLFLRGGLEERAEVVAEDAGEDHNDCDGEEDPVAENGCQWSEDCELEMGD